MPFRIYRRAPAFFAAGGLRLQGNSFTMTGALGIGIIAALPRRIFPETVHADSCFPKPAERGYPGDVTHYGGLAGICLSRDRRVH